MTLIQGSSRNERWPLIKAKWRSGTCGTLSQMLAGLRKNLPLLIPYLQIITCRMCWITYHDYQQGQSAWTYRWKGTSHDGYHLRKNKLIDYGNQEYVTILRFLHMLDDDIAKCLDYLITYWPSLNSF